MKLIIGKTYTVEEVLTDAQAVIYTSEQTDNGGIVSVNTARITITNTVKTGSLTINKTVVILVLFVIL